MIDSGSLAFRRVPPITGRCSCLLIFLLLVFPTREAAAFFQEEECIILNGSTQSADLNIEVTADKTVVPAVSPGGEPDANLITYTIHISNPSDASLKNIDFQGQLFDGNGAALAESFFQSINFESDDFAIASFTRDLNPLRISGRLALGPKEAGEILVKARLKEIPARNILTGRVSAFVTGTLDTDLKNNWSTVETVVQSEGKDIMIRKTTDSSCLSSDGNTITLTIINVGTEVFSFDEENLTINDDASTSEGTITPYLVGEWEYLENVNNSNRKVSFGLKKGNLDIGESTSVSYHIAYQNNYFYEVRAKIEGTVDQNIENNTSEMVKFSERSDPPTLKVEEVFYLQGERADYLSVTGEDALDEFNWYYTPNGSAFPGIKPSTAKIGTTTYYVSRSNNGCESELSKLYVKVVGPVSGSIGTNREVCRNTSFVMDGTDEKVQDYVDKNFSYSYEWQIKLPELPWSTVNNAVEAFYNSPPVPDATSFRRFTILTRKPDEKCVRSAPTAPVIIATKPCMVGTNPQLPSAGWGL